ncbi:MAG: hypothetical protein Q8N45_06890, partial [Anaerolineales bacterium]|nr:hypothetical protein [Anaerolineales bacterium]
VTYANNNAFMLNDGTGTVELSTCPIWYKRIDLHEGDEVEAMVLEVNRRKKQIRLSIKATQPKPPVGLREEILAEAKTEPKRRRGKKGKSARPEAEAVEAGPSTPEPTAMEIAWQEAMQHAESKRAVKIKKTRVSTSREQEDILNRTLVNRLPTG